MESLNKGMTLTLDFSYYGFYYFIVISTLLDEAIA
jgi:hypothetical protein